MSTETPIPWSKFVTQNAEVWPSPSTPAWQHRNREENGLAESGALAKVQGRWYVFPSKFWRWFSAGSRAAA